MELSVFGIVLVAALFHATWNTFVKKNEDRVLFMALLTASSATGALVAPIALVAAVRETSIIFALLFGVLLLKERPSLMQYFAIFTTMLGTVLLKLNRS